MASLPLSQYYLRIVSFYSSAILMDLKGVMLTAG